MTINVGKFVSTVHQENLNLCDEKNLLIYARTIQQLKLGAVFAVNSFSDLPSPATNAGKLYYVKNNEELFYSNGGLGWTRINDSCFSLWGWGRNAYGQLELGNSCTNISTPFAAISKFNNITMVSANNAHTYIINTRNQLWSTGRNAYGTLADGQCVNRSSFVREFCSATDWASVSGGALHAVAVKLSGQLLSWGANCNGSLGIGSSDTTGRSSPVREFCSATDWCKVSGGSLTTAAIKTSGQLWTWGRNCCGVLGIGSSATIGRCSPVREFCSATDWCEISNGSFHMVAIKTTGQLWTWGTNSHGQLGDGTTLVKCSPVREFCSATNWCQVSAGCSTLALKNNGELWVWGYNAAGQLGIGTTINRCSPVREFCSATDWRQISHKTFTSAGIKTTGQLWTWGQNTNFQLADSTSADRCSPIREFCSATDWSCIEVAGVFMVALKTEKYF